MDEQFLTKQQKRWWIGLFLILWLTLSMLFTIANWSIFPPFEYWCGCTNILLRIVGYIGNATASFVLSGFVVAFVMILVGRWIVPAMVVGTALFNKKKCKYE